MKLLAAADAFLEAWDNRESVRDAQATVAKLRSAVEECNALGPDDDQAPEDWNEIEEIEEAAAGFSLGGSTVPKPAGTADLATAPNALAETVSSAPECHKPTLCKDGFPLDVWNYNRNAGIIEGRQIL